MLTDPMSRMGKMVIENKMLVTGGAGFIGSNFVRYTLNTCPGWRIVNLDALTYAGNLTNLADLPAEQRDRHRFVQGDIRDGRLIRELLAVEQVDVIVHFAAESHVDRSILGPAAFLETNVQGTFCLLEAAREHWRDTREQSNVRFLHVSTDEVFGSLGADGFFNERSAYNPSSPYSASKAASDHFVRAYHATYGLPAVVTNCSNNYGPYQFPEKLIPLMILNIVEEKPLPVYGDGQNVRDWLYVEDHCAALLRVLQQGQIGQTYAIGGSSERCNIDIIRLLCQLVDERLGRAADQCSERLIRFVTDRPGHDRRYAIDASKIRRELDWQPRYSLEQALRETVDWYLRNMAWVASVRSGEYRRWVETQYGQR